ncbi:MAG: adenosylcobinamide-GDP ribazoletransferase, partial [Actinomycetes bacterium]
MLSGLRLAAGLLTVLPVGPPAVDRRTAARAMALAPVVGLLLGALAGGTAWVADVSGLGTTVAAVLAVGALVLLTRGLHLDGLADTADGLGCGDRDRALQVMRASDIGPFGVVTVLLVVLVQVAALAEALGAGRGTVGIAVAVVTGRATLVWACRQGVPAARPEGLGALVAGSVSTSVAC